jgi:hypothetical protein
MFHKNLKNNIHQRCHCPITFLSFNNISEEKRNSSFITPARKKNTAVNQNFLQEIILV